MTFGCETLLPYQTYDSRLTHRVERLNDGTYLFATNHVPVKDGRGTVIVQRFKSNFKKVGNDNIIESRNTTNVRIQDILEEIIVVDDERYAVVYRAYNMSETYLNMSLKIFYYNGTDASNAIRIPSEHAMITRMTLFHKNIVVVWIESFVGYDTIFMSAFDFDGKPIVENQNVVSNNRIMGLHVIPLSITKLAIVAEKTVHFMSYNYSYYAHIYTQDYQLYGQPKMFLHVEESLFPQTTMAIANSMVVVGWKSGNARQFGVFQMFNTEFEPIFDNFTTGKITPIFMTLSSGSDHFHTLMVATTIGISEWFVTGIKMNENEHNVSQRMSCLIGDTLGSKMSIKSTSEKNGVYLTMWLYWSPLCRYGAIFCADELTLDINTLTINNEQHKLLTTDNVYAIFECDSNNSDYTYTITNQDHITFEIDGENVTSFTNEDIAGGYVWVYHDGSGIAPKYDVSVSYNNHTTIAKSAIIIFNGEKIIEDESSSCDQTPSSDSLSSNEKHSSIIDSESNSESKSANDKSEKTSLPCESSKQKSSNEYSSDSNTKLNSDTKSNNKYPEETYSSENSYSSKTSNKSLPIWSVVLITFGGTSTIGASIAGGVYLVRRRMKKSGNVEMS